MLELLLQIFGIPDSKLQSVDLDEKHPGNPAFWTFTETRLQNTVDVRLGWEIGIPAMNDDFLHQEINRFPISAPNLCGILQLPK